MDDASEPSVIAAGEAVAGDGVGVAVVVVIVAGVRARQHHFVLHAFGLSMLARAIHSYWVMIVTVHWRSLDGAAQPATRPWLLPDLLALAFVVMASSWLSLSSSSLESALSNTASRCMRLTLPRLPTAVM